MKKITFFVCFSVLEKFFFFLGKMALGKKFLGKMILGKMALGKMILGKTG